MWNVMLSLFLALLWLRDPHKNESLNEFNRKHEGK
jgi:hypothetical protein